MKQMFGSRENAKNKSLSHIDDITVIEALIKDSWIDFENSSKLLPSRKLYH